MDKLQWGNIKWLKHVQFNDGGVVDKSISLPPVPSAHPPCRSSISEENGMECKEKRCMNTKRRHSESSDNINKNDNGKIVWPRLLIALSSKEKEEDFMIMKGCKPSQRPKKRAKSIQKTILLMSPGAWLTDVCRERYQVKEKTCKKKHSGLKAMQSMEVDLE